MRADLSSLAGIVCLAIGGWMIHPAAAWLIAGAFLVAIGVGLHLANDKGK